MTHSIIIPALKSGAAAFAAGWAAVIAQTGDFPLDGVGTVGLIGVLAVLVGRYTFRQLEDYRTDLSKARERIDDLEDELHKLGKAKAATDRRNRELEAYSHRLELWAVAAGANSELPPPEFPQPPPAPA